MQAAINSNPAPNEIDLGGDALARHCTGTPEPRYLYQFWRHTAGETFAVMLADHDKPVATCGPLHYTEVHDSQGNLLDPSEFNFDDPWNDKTDSVTSYTLIE